MKTLLILAGLLFVGAADAEVIKIAKDRDGNVIRFHDDLGSYCTKPTKHADHIDAKGFVTQGCYLVKPQGAVVFFSDGDIANVPFEAMSDVKDL